MILVVDTSAAIEIVLERPKSTRFVSLVSEAEWVIAPDLFISEVTNTFWKAFHFGKHPVQDCEEALGRALAIPDDLISGGELAVEAFALACLTRMPAYDMFYAVLARRHSAVLLTADGKLAKTCIQNSVRVEGA